MFLCLWTRIPRQRPPVTAPTHSDVTHESTHVVADAVVKMSLPSPQDGRTDGLTPQGRKPAPTAPLHPPHTQDTRRPRAHTGTHGTHGRQARHTHPQDPPHPPRRHGRAAAVKMFTRRGQDVCATDPRPAGRTDGRTPSGRTRSADH